jgi:Rad3-related DNA helicase
METPLRDWQKEKLQEAVAVAEKEKVIFLKAPTGSGKTLFSLVLGKQLKKKILFLTRTHSEFEPVRREAEKLGMKVAYLFGKTSVCPHVSEKVDPEDIDCDSCKFRNKLKDMSGLTPSQIIQVSRDASDFCPYYSLWESLSGADIIASSYLYFFNPVLRKTVICDREGCLKPENLMVIVDEAHNLVSADEWFMRRITKKSVEGAIKELEKIKNRVRVRFTLVYRFLKNLEGFLNDLEITNGCKELHYYPEPSFDELVGLATAHETYRETLKGPVKKSHLGSIFRFYNTKGTVYNCGGDLTVIPSDTFKIVEGAFKHASISLLMSGTLPEIGLKGYRINVDLKIGRPEYYYCDNIDSVFRLRPVNAPKYAKLITEIYKRAPSNVLVFFPSYEFKDEVRKHIGGVPLLEENERVTHEEVLEVMKGGKYAVLLVIGAKESEGVEFREGGKNLFQDMVLAGLPYPNVKDDVVKKRIETLSRVNGTDKERTARELTLIKVAQTIGRAFRDPNDYARIYFCDRRFKEYFPDLGLEEKDVKSAVGLTGSG